MRHDKKLHLAAGIVIGTVVGMTVSPLAGLGYAIAAGIIKELYDSLGYGDADIWDAVVTVIGGGLGYGALMVAA